MQLSEALLSRDEAVRLATEELTNIVARNERYYGKLPGMRPDPARPLLDGIRADDAWYYIPFARSTPEADPIFVRVNGLTRVVVVDRTY